MALIGAAALAGGGAVRPRAHEPPTISAVIDVALGALLPYFGIRRAITDFSSLVFYVAAAKQTADSGLGGLDQFAAMSIMALFVLLPVLVPIILTIAAPATATTFLTRTNQVVNRYGRYVIVAISLAFGVYLAIKGLRAF